MNRCKLCIAPVLVGKNRRQLANPASERCRAVLIDLARELINAGYQRETLRRSSNQGICAESALTKLAST